MTYLRAWTTLAFVTFGRLLWSVGTLMLLFPLAACGLFVYRRHFGSITDPVTAFNAFSHFLLTVFASFVLPLCSLTYGTTSLGGDREERTLLFLLIRPLPRWLILSAKFAATLPLTLGFTCGAFWMYCRIAGPSGRIAFDAYLPAIFYTTLAYTALFHLIAAAFRHAVIVSLVYAMFMETLLGNVPGIIKRIAVNYYGRSMMFDAGTEHGLAAPDPQWFEPITGDVGRWTLWGVTLGAMLLAWWVFSVREYEEAA